ncbi:M24 family metallopeptidase [Paractinoplanes toevensis]|uniref:Peptidase n=1 Tax=Paractinoplanes toevensis TaxID=571911 RepID=A0A919TBW2_9ACTN|nr:M24 family metallopeptidase [Actinoplanes toevensis]GIM91585.1 putative peptidase [Actinoplanes toevensis]
MPHPVLNPALPGPDEFPTLSRAEKDRRYLAVRELMAEHNLDALVVFGSGRDMWDRYLTNETLHGIVVLTASGEATYLLGRYPLNRYDEPGQAYDRWVEDYRVGHPIAGLIESLTERSVATGTIGVVGLSSRAVGGWAGSISYSTWLRVLDGLPGANFVDVATPFEVLALVKSPEEQQMIRKAAALGEAACAAFIEATAVGVRESVIGAAALNAIVGGGGWILPPSLLLRSGSSRFAWGQPEWMSMGGAPRRLEAGDSVAAEIFACYGTYESQQQIDVVIGAPSPELAFLEEVCQQSLRAGLDVLKPGLTFTELAEAMNAPALEASCWNTGPHIQTVSGVIFNSATHMNTDQDPALRVLPKLPPVVPQDGDFVIQAGTAFAFEPNALLGGRRVCVGGTVICTDEGNEVLNTLPNRLVVV